jgi:hypothetical protein
MPECHRCARMRATAELRRTRSGYLCFDNGPGTRCAMIAHERRAEEGRARRVRANEANRAPEQLRIEEIGP